MSAAGPSQGANSAPPGQRSGDNRKRGDHTSVRQGVMRPARGTDIRTRRRLLLLAGIAIAPVLLSYLAYYLLPRDARVNYGSLLATRPIAPITGTSVTGAAFSTSDLRGRWVVLYAGTGRCDAPCIDALYASRQARTIQNVERERVRRVWLVIDDVTPSPRALAEHGDLTVARVSSGSVADFPEGADRIYLIDPLGNYVLAWPTKPDIKAMAKDLARLLRASAIG
jgi:hypothetical protein